MSIEFLTESPYNLPDLKGEMMTSKKGFTLVELLIVMAVIAILVAIIIPSFRGMQNEAWIAKAQKEVATLQTAIESYNKNKDHYPNNITTDLSTAKSQIVSNPLADPWKTDTTTTPNTYGYVTGNISSFGDYYVVYSKCIDGVKSWVVTGNTVASTGDDVIMSNLTVVKQ
jgi:prepilin-type N-terminal cleavage/methylation domain-containing protein